MRAPSAVPIGSQDNIEKMGIDQNTRELEPSQRERAERGPTGARDDVLLASRLCELSRGQLRAISYFWRPPGVRRGAAGRRPERQQQSLGHRLQNRRSRSGFGRKLVPRARILSRLPTLRAPNGLGAFELGFLEKHVCAAPIFAPIRALSADSGANFPASLLPSFRPRPHDRPREGVQKR